MMMNFEPAICENPRVPPALRRGIQPGQVAWSQSSQKLHKNTEAITKSVVARWQQRDANIVWQKKLSVDDLLRISRIDADLSSLPLTGVSPDGGVILYRSRSRGLIPLFSVEAKEQQNLGNAIERWFKNYTALKVVGPRMAYVTFCSGAGACPNGTICKTLNHAMLEYAVSCREYRPRKWNRLYHEGPSLFRSINGFSAARIEVILDNLMEQKLQEVDRR